jgi:hypothetical protein
MSANISPVSSLGSVDIAVLEGELGLRLDLKLARFQGG